MPLESVVAVPTFVPPAKVPLALPAGAVKVTSTPLIAIPLFFRLATRGAAKAVFTVALCGVPLTTVMNSVTGLFVSAKVAVPETPVAVAVTVYVPVVPLAVNAGAVAMPLEFVITTAVLLPLKLPVAPDNGAVNVTTTPLVATPPVVTVATNGAAKFMLITALCGVPLVAVMTSLTPDVFVRLKFATVDTPATVAVTV